MKNFLLIMGLLLVSFYSFSQNTGNVNGRVEKIRKFYNVIVKNKENFSSFSIQTPYEEGRILNNKIYYEFNNIKLITISEGGEFSGGFKEIYFNEGKIFFIYTGWSSESHWGNPPIHYRLIEKRYYFNENEEVIKILTKKKEGYNLSSIIKEELKNITNTELDINDNYECKQELKIGREYKAVLKKLVKIHE